MSKLIDLTGEKFGRLTVISRAGNKYSRPAWHCVCICGNTTTVVSSRSLVRGITKSCGCLRKERLVSHGMCHTPEYEIWKAMTQRCTNSNRKAYKNYGGRGIRVCDRWLDNFENFYEDMGPRPSDKHTIDRVENDFGYFPENCAWRTRTEQQRNRRCRNKFGYPGIIKIYNGKYVARIKVNGKLIHLGTFGTLEQAITARKNAERKHWK